MSDGLGAVWDYVREGETETFDYTEDDAGVRQVTAIEPGFGLVDGQFESMYVERVDADDDTATYRVALLAGAIMDEDGPLGDSRIEGAVFDYETDVSDDPEALLDEVSDAYMDGVTTDVLGMLGAAMGEELDDGDDEQVGYDTMTSFFATERDDLEEVYRERF